MNQNNKKKFNTFSFTLIEVLVFITILSLFFVAAASITTANFRNLKTQEHKILATHYAEELLVWLRGEKEADWNYFINKSTMSGTTYCFNNLDFNSYGNCSSYGLNNFFKREGTLIKLSDERISIRIAVSWIESGGTEYLVPINTIFSVWE